ncbi:MAG: hypothetical protein ACNI27_09390 [Desulfovibrio sp.]
MLIHFPVMHQELAVEIEGAHFFSPGYGCGKSETKGEGIFVPEDLPLPKEYTERIVEDSVAFGEQFARSADMAAYQRFNPNPYAGETTLTVKDELLMRLEGIVPEDDTEGNARLQGQFVLLLAWAYEKNALETQQLEKKLQDSMGKMSDALGLDEEDDISKALEMGKLLGNVSGPSGDSPLMSWTRVLEAMPLFLVEDTVLVCTDPEIKAALDEYGVEFSDAGPAYPEGATMAEAPVWKMIGDRRCPEDKPWLDRIVPFLWLES